MPAPRPTDPSPGTRPATRTATGQATSPSRSPAHRAQAGTGALLGLVAGLASTGIAVALYPVLRRSSEGLAIGAVAFRVVEGVLAVVGVTALMSLVSLSEQFVEAGGVDRALYATTGQALLAVQEMVLAVWLIAKGFAETTDT